MAADNPAGRAQAAKKAGKSQEEVRAGLEQLEKLLPDLVNLNRMRASDWVKLAADVGGVASKLILLKTLYPNADGGARPGALGRGGGGAPAFWLKPAARGCENGCRVYGPGVALSTRSTHHPSHPTRPPSAPAFSMVVARPKTLLLSEAAIQEDAAAVKRLLHGAKDVCAIVQVGQGEIGRAHV